MIDVVLLSFLVLIALAAIRLHDLFAVVMLFGVYSFMTAALFMDLDAVDVAFTEAAVGAGVTTVLMLSSLRLTSRWEQRAKHSPLLPILSRFQQNAWVDLKTRPDRLRTNVQLWQAQYNPYNIGLNVLGDAPQFGPRIIHYPQVFVTASGIQYGQVAAGIVLSILPTFALALYAQRYLVEGLSLGAVKG